MRMSWDMAVISSLLASQARFSLPSRSMTERRIVSISLASAAISSLPSAVIGVSISPAETCAALRESARMRLVSLPV